MLLKIIIKDKFIDERSVTNIFSITDGIGALTTGIQREYLLFNLKLMENAL